MCVSVLETIVARHSKCNMTLDFLGLDDHWLTVVLIHMLVGAAEQHTCISIEDITQKSAYKAPNTIRRYLAAFTEKGLAKTCRSQKTVTWAATSKRVRLDARLIIMSCRRLQRELNRDALVDLGGEFARESPKVRARRALCDHIHWRSPIFWLICSNIVHSRQTVTLPI